MRCFAIIPAAGSGTRFGSPTPKQYLSLGGRPILEQVVERFLSHPAFDRVIVAVDQEWIRSVQAMAEALGRTYVVAGGATRQESVRNAIRACDFMDDDLIAVHDAVRPLVTRRVIDAVIAAAAEHGGAIPALPVTDTIHVLRDGAIVDTPSRADLAAAQTPQCFHASILSRAVNDAIANGVESTDEAAAVRRSGGRVVVVPGDPLNFKITTPEDLERAESMLEDWRFE